MGLSRNSATRPNGKRNQIGKTPAVKGGKKKAISRPKGQTAGRPAAAVDGPQDEDIIADLVQVSDAHGRNHFRQYSAMNRYNPEGVTLEAIKLDLIAYVHDELHRLIKAGHDAPNRQLPKSEADTSSLCQDELPFGSDEFLIRSGDKLLASIMQSMPIAAIARADCMMAIGRWCYAAWHARSHAAKKHGQEMLEMIRPHEKKALPQFLWVR